MVENYDDINQLIHNKIEKYNEKFTEFKKNLDIQDEKIKKQCAKSIKKHIKKNPKKVAEKLANLAQHNIDTTEETEDSENEIKKIFKDGKKIKGGMVDDDNDYDDDNIKIEEITEEELKLNNTYFPIIVGIIISIFLYIFTFLILYFTDATKYYEIIIFKPLLIITNIIKSISN